MERQFKVSVFSFLNSIENVKLRNNNLIFLAFIGLFKIFLCWTRWFAEEDCVKVEKIPTHQSQSICNCKCVSETWSRLMIYFMKVKHEICNKSIINFKDFHAIWPKFTITGLICTDFAKVEVSNVGKNCVHI